MSESNAFTTRMKHSQSPAKHRSTKRRLLVALACSALLSSAPLSSFAQEAPPADRMPKLEDVVKDMKAVEGLFTLYRFDPSDVTRDPSKLVAVIPATLLNKDLMLATSISRGSMFGFPVGTDLVRFEVSGNLLLLVAPDMTVKPSKGQAIEGAVEATYQPRYLAAMPILSRTQRGDVAVDFGGVLAANAGLIASMGEGGPRGAVIRYPVVKSFPDNVLVDVNISRPSPAGGSNTGVSFSFRRLPELGSNGFKPRQADERVGYFTTVRQDWNASYNDRETVVRYINKWNLQKKDPSLELSPPVKPITFIIEKNVPLQWRRFVAEGIADWNKAFEKIGISGAIVVQQQTDDNEFANIDPEDARYNFIRWIVTGRGFAMGPSRPDPRTGEILDADIIFDDAMVRFQFESLGNLIGPGAWADSIGPDVLEFLEAHPDWIPAGVTMDDVRATADRLRLKTSLTTGRATELLTDIDPAGDAHRVASADRPLVHASACHYATGLRQQIIAARLLHAAAGPEKKLPERVVGEIVRNVVAHEVGHTIGLRHNFIASTWLSPEEIKRRRDNTDEPTYASVMDYDALLLFPGDDLNTVKRVVTPTIGPYDHWAVEFGYSTGTDADAAKIASRTNEPGLAYLTDEDVMGLASPDPRANRWDMSSDPVAWAKLQIELADQLLKDFQNWAVKPSDPNYYLRDSFMTLMSTKTRPLSYVARVVGGQEFNRNRSSDPNAVAPLKLVSPERQREALDLLASTVFNDDFLKVETELFNKLVPSRHWDDGFGMPPARVDFPVHQVMLSLQSGALMQITNPTVLQRVYDAEAKTAAEDKFTTAELISRVRKIVVGDLNPGEGEFSDAKPMLSSIKRNLQRQYVNNLLAIARTRPGTGGLSPDVHGMIRFTLADIQKQFEEAAKAGKIDLATRAHLSEVAKQIELTLDADDVNVNLSMPMIIGRENPTRPASN